MTMTDPGPEHVDLVGLDIGPFNLALGAHGAATIINALTRWPVRPPPTRVAHTAFAPAVAAAADPGIALTMEELGHDYRQHGHLGAPRSARHRSTRRATPLSP
jgi:hypothetical protein